MIYASKIEELPGELTTGQARPDKVADLLMEIITGFNLTDFERELVLQKLNERNLTISTPRAGKTLGAVVDFVRKDKAPGVLFTIEEVKAALSRDGMKVTPKEIYNALGYLTRKKHIQKVGYGQYATSRVEKEIEK